jgi:hypothetical protein
MNINIYEEFAKQAKRFTTCFQKRDFLADKARFLEEEVAKKSPKYTQEQLAEIRKKRFVTADEIRALQTAEEKIRLEANKKFSEFRWRALKMEKGLYRW